MSKSLIAYFSATGTTAALAEKLAQVSQADLFEIRPDVAYSAEDLNWNDPRSRTSLEGKDSSLRPHFASLPANFFENTRLYLGFPIWWYRAPNIIYSFLESLDLSDKEIYLFATSGGSSIGRAATELSSHFKGINVKKAALLNRATTSDLLTFLDTGN